MFSLVKHTVLTEVRKNKEIFGDYYTNQKARPLNNKMANADTLDGAGVNSGNALDSAKVQLNSDISKENQEKIREQRILGKRRSPFHWPCQATVAHRSRCRKQRHPATPDGNPHTRGNREVQEAKAGISLKKFSKICISHIYYIYLHQNSANYGSNSKKEFPIESVKA